ncbi:MAG: hypothetical protein MJH10_07120 [Epibacterium sp.]|nr:hypothetical protein [Epibacterium sp.]NQX73312.1 hypothetical protein [Epibacterium sp.]
MSEASFKAVQSKIRKNGLEVDLGSRGVGGKELWKFETSVDAQEFYVAVKSAFSQTFPLERHPLMGAREIYATDSAYLDLLDQYTRHDLLQQGFDGEAPGALVLGQGEAHGAYSTWDSQSIDVSGTGLASIGFTLSSKGKLHNSGAEGDFLAVVAVVDGVEYTRAVFTGATGADAERITLHDIPTGSEMTLRFKWKASEQGAAYQIDDLEVTAAERHQAFFTQTFDDATGGARSGAGWVMSQSNTVIDAPIYGGQNGAIVFSQSAGPRMDSAFSTLTTEAIDISAKDHVFVTFSLSGIGRLDPDNWDKDYLLARAEVQTGDAIELVTLHYELGKVAGDTMEVRAEIPEGESVRLIFDAQTDRRDEAYVIDDIALFEDLGPITGAASNSGHAHDNHGRAKDAHAGQDAGKVKDHTQILDLIDHIKAKAMGGAHDGHHDGAPVGHVGSHNMSGDTDHAAHGMGHDNTGKSGAVAVKSGAWSDPFTWAGLEPPATGDSVWIPKGIAVTYDLDSNTELDGIAVEGGLTFRTDIDTKMVVDTLIAAPGSSLIIGTEENPIEADVTANIVIKSQHGSYLTQTQDGRIENALKAGNTDRMEGDTGQLGLGIVTHGQVRIHGEDKTDHAKVAEHPKAGDDMLVFDGALQGWSIGDQLVVTGTVRGTRDEAGNWYTQDELATIEAISFDGNQTQVTLSEALTYDHTVPDGYEDQLFASVGNLSRNIVIESHEKGFEIDEIGARGHVMFMHHDDVNVEHAAFVGLGRTDKSRMQDHLPVEDKYIPWARKSVMALDRDGDPIPVEEITNQPGRYGLHIHRAGTTGREQALLEGNVVLETPGWGIVHHDSHAAVNDNVVFGVRGGAVIAESGNETGEWINNLAVNTSGTDGQGALNPRQDQRQSVLDDSFHQGVAFAFKSRLITSEDNIAVSAESTGYMFNHTSHHNLDYTNLDFAAVNGFDPFGGKTSIGGQFGPNQTPTRHFADNEVYASSQGFFSTANKRPKSTDATNLVENFEAWEVFNGIRGQYQNDYTFKGGLLLASQNDQQPFVSHQTSQKQHKALFNVTSFGDLKFVDMHVEGFYSGLNGGRLIDLMAGVTFADMDTGRGSEDLNSATFVTDDLEAYEDLSLLSLDINMDASDLSRVDSTHYSVKGWRSDSIQEREVVKVDSKRVDIIDYIRKVGYFTKADGTPVIVLDLSVGDSFTGSVGVMKSVITLRDLDPKADSIHLGQLDPDLEDGFGALEIVDLRLIGTSGNQLEAVNGVTGTVLTGDETANALEASDLYRTYVFAGDGDDTVTGGVQDDWIKGSGGDDQLTGGAGADLFIFGVGMGQDVVADFDATEGDMVRISAKLMEAGMQSQSLGGDLVVSFGAGAEQITFSGITSTDDLVFA